MQARMFTIILAIILLANSNFTIAAEKINRVKKAEDFMQANMSSEATYLLQQEIHENPRNAKAHLLLGTLALSSLNYSEAQSRFSAAVNFNPGLRRMVAENYLIHATMNIRKYDLGKMNSFYEKSLQFDPSFKKTIEQRLYNAIKVGCGEYQGNMLLLGLVYIDGQNKRREIINEYITLANGQHDQNKTISLLETGFKFTGNGDFKKQLLTLYVSAVNDEHLSEDIREKYRKEIRDLAGEEEYARLLPEYKELSFGEHHISCSANTYTGNWFVIPDDARTSISSADYNYLIVYPDGKEFKDGVNVTLPKTKKFKIKAITDQSDIRINIIH